MKRDDFLADRPYDWQDKVVMRACIVVCLLWLLIALLP